MHQILFWLGLWPRSNWESSPQTLDRFEGCEGTEGKKRKRGSERKGKGREGMERREWSSNLSTVYYLLLLVLLSVLCRRRWQCNWYTCTGSVLTRSITCCCCWCCWVYCVVVGSVIDTPVQVVYWRGLLPVAAGAAECTVSSLAV